MPLSTRLLAHGSGPDDSRPLTCVVWLLPMVGPAAHAALPVLAPDPSCGFFGQAHGRVGHQHPGQCTRQKDQRPWSMSSLRAGGGAMELGVGRGAHAPAEGPALLVGACPARGPTAGRALLTVHACSPTITLTFKHLTAKTPGDLAGGSPGDGSPPSENLQQTHTQLCPRRCPCRSLPILSHTGSREHGLFHSCAHVSGSCPRSPPPPRKQRRGGGRSAPRI